MRLAVVRSRRMIGLAWCLVAAAAWAQAAGPSPECPQTTSGLYARIRSVGLDPQRVYQVREASIDRPNLHLDFDDGTLAFTEDICGRITGAFFEGEGEIRLRPPNRVERGSLALFTGMAILEEQFTSGYLRFNDDTAEVLRPFLTPAPEGAEFIKKWSGTGRTLAEFDALRLLLDFSHFLPHWTGEQARHYASRRENFRRCCTLICWARNWEVLKCSGMRQTPSRCGLGSRDRRTASMFFDVWTSFAPSGVGRRRMRPGWQTMFDPDFRIRASVEPPTRLQASTEMNV